MVDSHLHTECSFDCAPGCSDGLGERALALGLVGFTVTDHLEVGVGQPERFRQDLLNSLDYVRALQKRFPMLDIGFGAELGQPHRDLREAAEAVSGLPLDFILASCHLVRGQLDFCDMAPGSYDPEALLEQYFREVLELVRSVDFDSLAHLTYPLRYFEGQHGVKVDLSRFSGLIDAIFSELILRGRSLEVNSSGWRQGMNGPLPHRELLLRYRALGGRRLTLGSDAHRTADLAADFPRTLQLLQELGFAEICYYRARKPIVLPLSAGILPQVI